MDDFFMYCYRLWVFFFTWLDVESKGWSIQCVDRKPEVRGAPARPQHRTVRASLKTDLTMIKSDIARKEELNWLESGMQLHHNCGQAKAASIVFEICHLDAWNCISWAISWWWLALRSSWLLELQLGLTLHHLRTATMLNLSNFLCLD